MASEKKKYHGVLTIDLLGPLLARMSKLWNMIPAFRPGLLKGVGEESIRLAEAIDFTLKHDNGKTPQGLAASDMVLVGLSRTGKTPLSTYLAQQGWKVANIPLHPDMDAPVELFKVKTSKVFALTIEVENLVRVRESRLEQLGLDISANYADPVRISDEIEWCEVFLKKHRSWRIVDIYNKAIEEVATRIVNLFHR